MLQRTLLSTFTRHGTWHIWSFNSAPLRRLLTLVVQRRATVTKRSGIFDGFVLIKRVLLSFWQHTEYTKHETKWRRKLNWSEVSHELEIICSGQRVIWILVVGVGRRGRGLIVPALLVWTVVFTVLSVAFAFGEKLRCSMAFFLFIAPLPAGVVSNHQ